MELAMFIADTFVTVAIVLLSVLASLYYFGVYRDVFTDFFSTKSEYDEKTAELLNSYMAGKENVEDQKGIERQ